MNFRTLSTLFLLFQLKSYSQVKLQTGSAEIGIPIYSFNDNLSRLNLNLSLHYSSGNGLLVDNISSPVGTGWMLAGIPKIIRIQKDLPDDQSSIYDPNGIAFQTPLVGVRGCPKILNYYPLWDNSGASYDDPLIVSEDKRVDEFQLFLNGRVIIFYLRTKFTFSQDGTAITLLNTDDKVRIIAYSSTSVTDNISSCTKIKRFVVLDENGITYEFSIKDYAKRYRYTLPNSSLSKSWQIAQEIINFPFVATAWNVSQISDQKNNRVINFEYSPQTLSFDNFSNLYGTGDNSTYPTSFVGTIKKNTLITNEIKSVTLPTSEKIEFNYNSSARKDILGAYGMNDIVIKNANLKRINRFVFNQSYFVKNEMKIPVDVSEEKWSRLCLLSLQRMGETDAFKEEPYVFNYYLGTNNFENFVPPVFFHAKDPWGYYNGDMCGVVVNRFLDKDATSLADWIKLCTYNQNHYPYSEYEITANCKTNYAANGLLKSYVNPLGGITEYEYDQNKTRPSSGMASDVIAGGVHVSRVFKSTSGNPEK